MDFANQSIYNKYKKNKLKKNQKEKEIGFFYLFLFFQMLTNTGVVLVKVKMIWDSLNKKMNKEEKLNKSDSTVYINNLKVYK